MKRSNSKKLLTLLIVLTIVIVSLHIFLKYVSIVVFDDKNGFLFELSNRFDLNDEASVPQWFTQLIFLAIGITSFITYKLTTKANGKYFWLLATVIGIMMSLDDAATLHEFVLQSLHNRYFIDQSSTIFTNAWMILLPFITLALLAVCYWAIKVLPRRTSIIFAIGGFVFLIGAVVVDSLTNRYYPQSFMARGVMASLEGGLQLIGSGAVLYAIVDYLEKHHTKRLASAWSRLNS